MGLALKSGSDMARYGVSDGQGLPPLDPDLAPDVLPWATLLRWAGSPRHPLRRPSHARMRARIRLRSSGFCCDRVQLGRCRRDG